VERGTLQLPTAFVGDIAQFDGLRYRNRRSSTAVFIIIYAQINTHPGMGRQLIEDNVKEMSSATRDGVR